MRIPIIIALTLLLTQTSAPKGVIEGRILRAGTHDPISDVLVTLVAPTPANAATNLSPDAAARLANQIGDVTQAGVRAGTPQESIDNAVRVLQNNAAAAQARPTTAYTDSSGHFSFRDLAPGSYGIRAEREGYFASPVNGTASNVVSKTILIQDGKPNAPEDLLMVKGAVISGRVRDPNSQPISGMTVSVYRVTYTNGRKTWTISNSKPTNDLGEYRIYWLYPGDYYVGVTPRTPGPVPGPQDTWMRTLFPGVTDPSTAVPVVIHDGSEVPGIDMDIRAGASTAYKISGAVINPTARANPGNGAVDRSIASFILAPRDPGVLDGLNPPTIVNALPTNSRQNGEFELRNIRPGAYDLFPVAPVVTETITPPPGTAAPNPVAVADPRTGQITTSIQIINGTVIATNSAPGAGGAASVRRQPTSRTPIEVTRDITDLRITVGLGVPLSGEVHLNAIAGQAMRLESLRLSLRSLDTLPAAFANFVGTIPVDASGKFSATNVPEARYTFQFFGLPSTAYVADIRQGGSSVMDNGFVLDSSAAPIQIVLEPNGATVEGTVQNAEGKPAANATVVLVPPPSRRQNGLLYRTASSSETGNFSLKGVPPGPYTIFAWESVLPTAWQNAEFLAPYENRGRPINVTTASSLEVQLNLIPIEERR